MLNFFSIFKLVNNSNATNTTYDEHFSSPDFRKQPSIYKEMIFSWSFQYQKLSKNLDKIEEFFNGMTRFPDAIAISETKLNLNSSSNNNISHYNFLHNDPPINAGGVGF